MSHLVEDFRSSDGIDLSSDNLAMHRLHEAAENAKARRCRPPPPLLPAATPPSTPPSRPC